MPRRMHPTWKFDPNDLVSKLFMSKGCSTMRDYNASKISTWVHHIKDIIGAQFQRHQCLPPELERRHIRRKGITASHGCQLVSICIVLQNSLNDKLCIPKNQSKGNRSLAKRSAWKFDPNNLVSQLFMAEGCSAMREYNASKISTWIHQRHHRCAISKASMPTGAGTVPYPTKGDYSKSQM